MTEVTQYLLVRCAFKSAHAHVQLLRTIFLGSMVEFMRNISKKTEALGGDAASGGLWARYVALFASVCNAQLNRRKLTFD